MTTRVLNSGLHSQSNITRHKFNPKEIIFFFFLDVNFYCLHLYYFNFIRNRLYVYLYTFNNLKNVMQLLRKIMIILCNDDL